MWGVAGSSGTCSAQAMRQAQAMQQAVLLAVQHKGASAAALRQGPGAEGKGYHGDSGGIRCCSGHHGGDIQRVGAGRCWKNCRLLVLLVIALIEQSWRKVEVGCWRWGVC